MARPTRTKEQTEKIQLSLCTAALQLYRENGYDAVTLRNVAAIVGVSHPTMYGYFASKEDLFISVRALAFHDMSEYLRVEDPVDKDPLSRLRHLIERLAEFGISHPADYCLLHSTRQPEVPKNSPMAIERGRVFEHAVSIAQLAIDAGQLRGDAVTLAHLIWAGIHGIITLHVSNHLVAGRTLDELLEPMLNLLLTPNSPELGANL